MKQFVKCPHCGKDIEIDCSEVGLGNCYFDSPCEHCCGAVRIEYALECYLHATKLSDVKEAQ